MIQRCDTVQYTNLEFLPITEFHNQLEVFSPVFYALTIAFKPENTHMTESLSIPLSRSDVAIRIRWHS